MSVPWKRWLRRWGVDRKRGLMALALLAVALLLWGRLILKKAPRTAMAEPKTQAAALAPAGASIPDITTVRVDLPPNFARDLFAVAASRFQRVDEGTDIAPTPKSIPEGADSQIRLRAVQQAAAALNLQTTILGATPRAMIDGQLLAPGDRIKGFVVREIEQRGVVLEMDGIQVRLDM